MRLKIKISTILCTVVILCFSRGLVFADSITPSIVEQDIAAGAKETQKVTYKNEGTTTVTVKPYVSAYDSKTLQLISEEKTLFITMDIETYDVEPGESLTLKYEIKPPANLAPGTYFNLIVLQKIMPSAYLTTPNTTGTIDSLSQLVAIHIMEKSDAGVLGITSNFASITMEVTDKGIPFLKPTVVKYTYQNITNYVLDPKGEIQVFDGKSTYAPMYKQINGENKKLYPQDTIEETISIGDWHLSDLLFGRKIVGYFYNGLDENSIITGPVTNTYYIYLGISLGIIVLLVILVKAIASDSSKKTK
jgi:hypothetical protein